MVQNRLFGAVLLSSFFLACGGDDAGAPSSDTKAKVDPLKRTITCKFTGRKIQFQCADAEHCIPKKFEMICAEDFMPLIPKGARSVNNWIKDGHWNERKGKWAAFQLKAKEISGRTIIASKNADINLKIAHNHTVKAKESIFGFGKMHDYDEGFMTDTLKLKEVHLVPGHEFANSQEYQALHSAIREYQKAPSATGADSRIRSAMKRAQRSLGPKSPLFKAAFALNKVDADAIARATATDEFNRDKKLLHALNFDLETVIGLVKKGNFKDYTELEATINDPNSGINNVDVDDDKKVDWVGIEEAKSGQTITLSFVAHPSGLPKDPSFTVAVAEITLNKKKSTKPSAGAEQQEEIEIEGGYPDYVEGYDNYYYRHRYHVLTNAQLARYMWHAERRAYERSWKQYQKVHRAQARRHVREMRAMRSSYRMKMGMVAIGAALIGAKLAARNRPASFTMKSPRAKPTVVAKTKAKHTQVRTVKKQRAAAKSRKVETKRKAAAAKRARTRSVRSRGRSSRSRGSRRGK